jgi:hypothetical protein
MAPRKTIRTQEVIAEKLCAIIEDVAAIGATIGS